MHNDSLPHSAFRGVYPLSSSDACWGKVGVPKWRSEMGALGGFDKANLGKFALEVEAARVWDAEPRRDDTAHSTRDRRDDSGQARSRVRSVKQD